MREISENNLRWFAARLSIAVEDTKRFGGMSIHDMKQALRDVPGVESLTMAYTFDGNLLVTIAGRTVEVTPTASNEEIALAFREPAMSTPNVTVTPPLPTVNFSTRTAPMSTPTAPGSFAASLKAMMAEARAGVVQARSDGMAKVSDAVGKLNDAKAATLHVAGTMAKTIEDEAADVMAELGQISNSLGGE